MVTKSKLGRSNASVAKRGLQPRLLEHRKVLRGNGDKGQRAASVCPGCGAPNPPKQRFFDERWLATRWGVSVKKLQADRAKGVGVKFTKLGDAVRYRLRDVVAFEKANTRTNTIDLEA